MHLVTSTHYPKRTGIKYSYSMNIRVKVRVVNLQRQCWAVNVKGNMHILREAIPTFNANAEGGVFLMSSSIAVGRDAPASGY